MNTAARLEESSRHVDGGFVASRAAIERLEGVLPCELHELGNLELRGRQRAVEAFGLGYPSATGQLAHAG
jgi:adenylate cyclase